MRALVGVIAASIALAPRPPQTPPVFRGGVDLVTVDVAVIDKDGRPVTRLAPADFSIVADKRPRKVVSADYVSVKSSRPPSPPFPGSAPAPPAPTTNLRPISGRTFLFVIDVERIAQGAGQSIMKSIAAYLDRFDTDDRVGLIALPFSTPRVDVTTNRQPVIDAAGKVIGSSPPVQNVMMTVGEAAAIEQLDEGVLNEYLERINARCGDDIPGLIGLDDDPTISCIQRFKPIAAKVMDAERHHTQALFGLLREFAEGMGPLDGPKAIVFVSQGAVNDRETMNDLGRFADIAEKSRVTLYALVLQESLSNAIGKYNVMSARVRDHQVFLDGVSRIATAVRGDTYIVSGSAEDALRRIDAEMSGYYLVSFERDADDRDGQRAAVQVNVNWPNAIVRARTEFTPHGKPAPTRPVLPADRKPVIGQLLRWPVPVADFGIDLDTYAVPVTGPGREMRTVIAASMATGGLGIAAAGFEVTDDAGKVIADDFDPSVTTPQLAGKRQLYAATLAMHPGHYRVKFAAIDASGRRASVEHAFDVHTARAGALRMSDVFVGELSAAGFLPNPALLPGLEMLPVRVELCGDTPAALAGATVTLELARPDSPPFARTPLSLSETADPHRRLASATLAIGSLPAGDYVVTAELLAADGADLRTSRMFTKR